MPSWELSRQQSGRVQGPGVAACGEAARVAVEAGTSFGWAEHVGPVRRGGRPRRDFGASAPYKTILEHSGFTVDNVVAKAREVMKKTKS